MFRVIIYEDKNGKSPVTDYLNELNAKARINKDSRIKLKKIAEYINLLKEYGTRAGLPASKHIENDIWELRPTNDRFFFAYWKDDIFVILHYYIKKSQKAPPREIEQAKRCLKDLLERDDYHDNR